MKFFICLHIFLGILYLTLITVSIYLIITNLPEIWNAWLDAIQAVSKAWYRGM
jgi:hypothetical protein